MPTEDEFHEAQERISQFVEDIGGEVSGGLNSQTGVGIRGPNVNGFWCTHGSHSYAIVGDPSDKYFQIVYPRLILENIAERLDEETIDELLSEYTEDEIEERLEQSDLTKQVEPENIPEEVIQQFDLEGSVAEIRETDELPEELDEEYIGGREYLASEEWLDSLEPALMQDIKYHLREKLTAAEVAFSLIPQNNNVVYGFEITKKFFPYEDNFGLQEFNDCVQAVVSIGVAGSNFLGTTFKLDDNFSLGDDPSTPTLPPA